MGIREFITPAEEEWINALGVAPEQVEGDEHIYVLHYPIGSSDHLDFSFDTVGSSIRFRWIRGEEVLANIFREGARRIYVRSGAGEAYVTVDFDTDGLHGQLITRILPAIRIEDALLFG